MKKVLEQSYSEEPLPMPKYAWVSFTGRCNLFCAHCPSRVAGKVPHSADDMSLELFEKIEAEVFPYLKICKIGGNNTGEQLVARDWDFFMQRIKKHPFVLWLITNGTKFDRVKIKDLVERESIIDISIEAATEKTYTKVRGSNLSSLIESVKAIGEERVLQKKRGEIRFSFTCFYDNITELPALMRLANELTVDRVSVTHLTPMNTGQRYQSLIFHRSLSNQYLTEARRLADELGLAVDLPPLFSLGGIDRVDGIKNETYPWLEEKCFHPWTTISINEKGDVTPCCISNTIMGNLNEQSLKEIWHSRAYRNLRRRVNSENPWGECRRCVLRGEMFTSVQCVDEEALLWIVGPWQHFEKTLIVRLGRGRIRDLLKKSDCLDRWIQKRRSSS